MSEQSSTPTTVATPAGPVQVPPTYPPVQNGTGEPHPDNPVVHVSTD